MIEKKCSECGKSFQVDNSKRNWQSICLCSQICCKARAARKKRKKYVRQEWPQVFVCEWCGKDFFVNNAGEKSQRKYCSRECYKARKRKIANLEAEKQREKKICLSCGAAFLATKYNNSRQKYCSKVCFRRSMWQKHGLPRRTNNDFARIRGHVLKDFKGICQLCGSKDCPQVHHYDNDHKNNLYDNLTVFCRACHNAVHRITLIKINDEWKVSGSIFNVVGLHGEISISP